MASEGENGGSEHGHDWYWMAESFKVNGDGETTTKRDYYECGNCGESKVEKTQLDYVRPFAMLGHRAEAVHR